MAISKTSQALTSAFDCHNVKTVNGRQSTVGKDNSKTVACLWTNSRFKTLYAPYALPRLWKYPLESCAF